MRLQQKADKLSEALASELRRARTEKGLSMNEVSTATGLAVSFIGYLERGERRPSVESLAKIAWACGQEPAAILLKAEAAIGG